MTETPPPRRNEFVRGRPFQVGLGVLAGLIIGCVGGLGVGFVAGHFGDRHDRRPHGFYQDGPRQDRDRGPVQPPRKVRPDQPPKSSPAPTTSPPA